MKKLSILVLTALMLTILGGCSKDPVYTKLDYTFFDSFDTITQIVSYTATKEDFDKQKIYLHDRMLELHKLFDKYNTYEGINNIKTINDNAGKMPVKVDPVILDMLEFGKDMQKKYNAKTNIAFGAVLEIWSEYRDEAEEDHHHARIPDIEDLKKANEHTDINKLIINREDSTVYLEDPDMSIDVGAIAKGYAVELVAKEMVAMGYDSWIMSAGGNIKSVGKPLDGERDRWGVGIQNPDVELFGDGSGILETVYTNDASVVASGDYQRFYFVGDKRIHHIIDPDTLMPADYYRAVNVIIEDSALADFYSTEVFLRPFEESKELVESVEGLEAIWMFADGRVEMTEGFKKISRSHGASGSN